MKELIKKVEQWFVDRHLHELDGHGQLTKLKEEVDELVDARLKDNRDEEMDAVGDITVVLIGYCMQRDLDFEKCLESAYNEIKDRKGKLINGVFVKEADLK
ncbi:MazG-like family protein [Carnobacteriaceae bacterium zg-ZUI78]|nr:MazG-like family protein [Carnobacteriaceae bacterium zg-ZUI78]